MGNGNGMDKPDLRPGYELTTEQKVGKLYDALRGDIDGAPGIFETLRVLDWRVKIAIGIATVALVFNNPIAQSLYKLIPGVPK